MRHPLPVLSLSLVAMLAMGCDPNADACSTESDRSTDITQDRQTLVQDNSDFAWSMYAQLSQPEENLFFSPASISAALDMTRLGAAGSTLDEMASVLGESLDEQTHHAEQGGLLTELDEADTCGVQLTVANRVFGQDGLNFESSFEEDLETDYSAPMERLDFSADPEGSREHINGWVAEKTVDNIPELLGPGTIGSATRLVLANAVWFKGSWAESFDPANTREAQFTLHDGSAEAVPTMHMEADLPFAQVSGASLVELPYEGEETSMVLIIPDDHDGLPELEASLSTDQVGAWMDELATGLVQLDMPVLEMRWGAPLNDPLIELGMSSAFGSTADFSGMTTEAGLFISAVVHEAFVSIDEEGTEAAAATAVVMDESAANLPTEISADHPYLFIIRDRITDTVLFIGRVADPTAG